MEIYLASNVTYPDGNDIFFVKTMLTTVSAQNAADMVKLEQKIDVPLQLISVTSEPIMQAGYAFGQRPKYSIDETGKVTKDY